MISTKELEELNEHPYYVTFLGEKDGRTICVRVKEYSQEEYDEFIKAREVINDTILDFMDLYGMVALTYSNLISSRDKRIEAVKAEMGISARDDLVEINAYFASLIANFAMYLGCVPTKISSNRKQILEVFRKATHKEYDGSFAYRLFYYLRNYTLHDTPPITGIRGSSRLYEKTGETEVDYEIYIEKSKLLRNDVLAKKLAPDFVKPPDIYPVIELATEAITSLKNIHWTTIKALTDSIKEEILIIEKLKGLVPDHQPYITAFTYNEKTETTDAKLELIPTNVLEIRRNASKY